MLQHDITYWTKTTVEDNRGKAVEWHLVNYKITCYNVFDEKTVSILSLRFVSSLQSLFCTWSALCTRSAVCILNLVCISVPGEQSAVCILYWPLSYQCLRSLRRSVRHFEFLWWSPLCTCSRSRFPVAGFPFPVPRSPFPVPRSQF